LDNAAERLAGEVAPMPVAYTGEERAALNARASARLEATPSVGAFIRDSLSRDPTSKTLIYLRTALDPAPVVAQADEFVGLMRTVARWLRRNGVGRDDAVALFAPNCTATTITFFGAMSAAKAQPLNLLFSRQAILAQINASQAKILFAPPPGAPGGLFEKVVGLEAEAPSLERIVALPLDGRLAFDDEALSPVDSQGQDEVADIDSVCALLSTGGTTGTPKIVPLTHRNVLASAIGTMLFADLRPSDRNLIALPLFHVGGAFCGSLATLGAGATIVIPTVGGIRNPEVVANYWRIVERHRITIGALVPTGLGAVAATPLAGADISSLRTFLTGASLCPPEIERRFLDVWKGDCVRQLYGMTEFAGAASQTPLDRAQPPSAVGIPLPLAELAVLADGEIHVRDTPSGEILMRGPQMFGGYLDPRQIGATFYEGWLRSGDLGRIGADGEVYVTGRAKDLIIRGGHNIDPSSIEDVALKFPGVGLAAAVGRPDAYAGETPVLFVSPTPGRAIDSAALADFVQAGVLEPPARPRAIVVIEDMPMTPVGKIFKPRLRELAAEAAAREALEGALGEESFSVSAAHEPSGLVLRARVPATWGGAARAALGAFPVEFEVIAE
jgi:fatty-acyl-CoA synthase